MNTLYSKTSQTFIKQRKLTEQILVARWQGLAAAKMNRFNQIGPLKNPSDLTEKNLTNLFSKYFDDQTLKLEILEEDEKFIEDNDNFQSLVTLFPQSDVISYVKL